VPDALTLKRNRDLVGIENRPWTRRALLALLCLPLLAGLLNAFGQRPTKTEASVAPASLSVYAPKRVRGGLYYESRRNLDRNRITFDEVAAAAREQQLESVDKVKWVLETNGRISIVPKQ